MPEEDERVKIMTHTTKVRVVNSSLIFGLKTQKVLQWSQKGMIGKDIKYRQDCFELVRGPLGKMECCHEKISIPR